uniref:Fatty acyl-CoA reductase C-terminal domain-containing protein n=1 Tax=Timema bartmani TaxID=61472 RepID=A0A7R9FBH1_9NEOP|nr:unnamed protein product [Timema bartmani]
MVVYVKKPCCVGTDTHTLFHKHFRLFSFDNLTNVCFGLFRKVYRLFHLCSSTNETFLKMYRKIDKYILAMRYFSTFEWDFNNNKCMSLFNSLSENDKEIFFFDVSTLNYKDYILNSIKWRKKIYLQRIR